MTLAQIERQIQHFNTALHAFRQQQEIVMATLAYVQSAYTALEARLTETETYLAGVPALIAAAASDPAALQALADKITSDTATLGAALDAAPKPADPAAPTG